jgi:hypothetical protein
MREVRTISLIVLLLGLLYVAAAVVALYQYWGLTKLFEYYGISASEQLNIDSIVRMRRMLLGAIMLFTIASLLTLPSAVGLFFAKEWARKLWLVVVLMLALFHLVRLVADARGGVAIMVMRLLEVALIGLVASISWRRLTSESLKGVFRRGLVSATYGA